MGLNILLHFTGAEGGSFPSLWKVGMKEARVTGGQFTKQDGL